MIYQEKERIMKAVLTAESVRSWKGLRISDRDNPLLCDYCKSPLFYIRIILGVIDETEMLSEYRILKLDKKHYALREIGFILYCAECGGFHEQYDRFFYPKDKIICSSDDDEFMFSDSEEIWHCINQFNKTRNFKPSYPSSSMKYLNKKLLEYESKNKKIKRSNKNEKKRT